MLSSASPSIDFSTDQINNNRPFGFDQISVLFRRLYIYIYEKKKTKNHHRLHTYTAEFCARKCYVKASADDVINYAVKIKDDATLCCC